MGIVLATATCAACAAIEGLGSYDTSPGTDASVDQSMPPGDVLPDLADRVSVDEGNADGSPEADVATPPSDALSNNDAPLFDAGSCASAVDLVHGVFVAPGGVDGVGCGTAPSSPCQTIGAGIATASIKPDAGVDGSADAAGDGAIDGGADGGLDAAVDAGVADGSSSAAVRSIVYVSAGLYTGEGRVGRRRGGPRRLALDRERLAAVGVRLWSLS